MPSATVRSFGLIQARLSASATYISDPGICSYLISTFLEAHKYQSALAIQFRTASRPLEFVKTLIAERLSQCKRMAQSLCCSPTKALTAIRQFRASNWVMVGVLECRRISIHVAISSFCSAAPLETGIGVNCHNRIACDYK